MYCLYAVLMSSFCVDGQGVSQESSTVSSGNSSFVHVCYRQLNYLKSLNRLLTCFRVMIGMKLNGHNADVVTLFIQYFDFSFVAHVLVAYEIAWLHTAHQRPVSS